MRHMTKSRSALWLSVALLIYAVLGAGCASSGKPGQAAAVPEIRPGVLAGYLLPAGLPNSLALVPPPPAAGSAAFARDEEASRKALSLRGTPRWKLATEDAEPGVSTGGRHILVRSERPDNGTGDAAPLCTDASSFYRRGPFHLCGQGTLQSPPSVHGKQSTHLHTGRGRLLTEKWLVSLRP